MLNLFRNKPKLKPINVFILPVNAPLAAPLNPNHRQWRVTININGHLYTSFTSTRTTPTEPNQTVTNPGSIPLSPSTPLTTIEEATTAAHKTIREYLTGQTEGWDTPTIAILTRLEYARLTRNHRHTISTP